MRNCSWLSRSESSPGQNFGLGLGLDCLVSASLAMLQRTSFVLVHLIYIAVTYLYVSVRADCLLLGYVYYVGNPYLFFPLVFNLPCPAPYGLRGGNEVNISLAFLHWVGIALHPWHFVSYIAIFVLKETRSSHYFTNFIKISQSLYSLL